MEISIKECTLGKLQPIHPVEILLSHRVRPIETRRELLSGWCKIVIEANIHPLADGKFISCPFLSLLFVFSGMQRRA
jgi:hypothetical protein